MIDPRRAALIMIDMQKGFIEPSSALCVAGAEATVSACARALSWARKHGMEVLHVRRKYAADGHDVEPVRYEAWRVGGRPLCVEGEDPATLDPPDLLTAADGDRVMLKPSFSAFFGTPLHNLLKRAGINTVVLMGTTTPNCIRATCYDAFSLKYNVVVLEDATSSRMPEVQAANIEDMRYMGAHIMTTDEFCERGLEAVRDVAGEVARAVSAAQAEAKAAGATTAGEDAGGR